MNKLILCVLLFAFPAFSQVVIAGATTIGGATTLGSHVVSVDCPGVVGDFTTDDTAAMQACINATPDYYELLIPAGYNIKITSTLTINGRYGFRLAGMSSAYGGPSIRTNAPAFYWGGADGGTMLKMDCTMNFIIENVAFFGSLAFDTGTNGANVGIDVDQTGTGACVGGPVTTNGIFRGIAVYGTTRRTTWRGIQFSAVSGNNVEKMTVDGHSIFYCSYDGKTGIGIWNGQSSNAMRHLYMDVSVVACATGIWLGAGSGDIIHNQLQGNAVAIHDEAGSTVLISMNDAENNDQFFVGGHSGLSISSNRIAASNPPMGHGIIDNINDSMFEVSGNFFDLGSIAAVVCLNGGGGIVSRNNSYPDSATSLPGLATCQRGGSSNTDSFNYGLALLTQDITYAPGPLTTLAQFAWAGNGTPVRLSEGAAPLRPILSYVQTATPTCTTTAHIGATWYDTNTTTTVLKACMNVSGTVGWVTK